MARKDAKSHDHGQLSLLPKPVKSPKPTETEVEAYAFIRQQLRDLGWIVKDPSKNGNGQVWTQNQCLADAHMKVALGLVRPENVVKLSEKFLWVIEAKPTRKELDKALAEATEFYSEKINATKGQYKPPHGNWRRGQRGIGVPHAHGHPFGWQVANSHD